MCLRHSCKKLDKKYCNIKLTIYEKIFSVINLTLVIVTSNQRRKARYFRRPTTRTT